MSPQNLAGGLQGNFVGVSGQNIGERGGQVQDVAMRVKKYKQTQ